MFTQAWPVNTDDRNSQGDMEMKRMLPIGILLLISVSGLAHADSWRCGRQIVKTGDSVSAVIQRCGRPDFTSRGRETIQDSGRRSVTTQRWTYNTARGQRSKTLVFVKGRLLRIEHDR